MAFLVTYWYLFAIVLVALAVLSIRYHLKGKARTTALKYLLAAEKMLFTNTDSKLAIVSTVAYDALPSFLRVFITPSAFKMLVTISYDEAKKLIEELSRK